MVQPTYYNWLATQRSNLAVPYVAVDPFLTPPIIASGLPVAYKYGQTPIPTMVYSYQRWILFKALAVDILGTVAEFIFDTVPRQIYLQLLFRLPDFYSSRVDRICKEAERTIPEIKEMSVANVSQLRGVSFMSQTGNIGPQMLNLKTSWERFIDSLLEEWKALNIISVLLLSYVFRPGGFHFFLMLEQRHPHIVTDSRRGK